MVRALKHITIISLMIILILIIYYVFFTYPKYSGNKFLNYIHVFMFFMFIIGLVYGIFILKLKLVLTIPMALVILFMFTFLADTIDEKYGYMFSHFYSRHPYTNLLQLNEYRNINGNYITIKDKLSQQGVVVDSIYEGHIVDVHEGIDRSITRGIYYINKQYYIIFDWIEEDVVILITKEEVSDLLLEKINTSAEIIEYKANYIDIKIDNGDLVLYNIVSTDNLNFDFIQLGE
ncbi:hypothetical protein J2T56_001276 [Natronobacillus azotifigens]|uniref:Uncharacterized protein n=1 Tax=Natronobacillus azotifigens TaxID=472978 RepID=A0A9J6RBF1_9BACI|nr:hypothetical protein [Natronobacillus azotifigens]MCZ0703010.1 hypothetical protein [Natronobacillus azotifigens]